MFLETIFGNMFSKHFRFFFYVKS